VALGDKVIVYPWLGCGECAVCLRGDDHLCPRAARNLGIQLPGGYADMVRVPHSRYLVPIGTLEPARAATFACAGITAYGAIRKLNPMTAEDHVAIIGCGGVGMTAVALLSATSQARIVAIDPDPAKREAALRYGASLAFDPNEDGALRTIGKACNNDIAGVVDFVGAESTSSLAVNLVRRTGQVVIVGLFGGEFRMPLPMFAIKSLQITGSYVAGLEDLRELVALAQRVDLPQIPLDLRPMASVNQALDDLSHGRVVGRAGDGELVAARGQVNVGELLDAHQVAVVVAVEHGQQRIVVERHAPDVGGTRTGDLVAHAAASYGSTTISPRRLLA